MARMHHAMESLTRLDNSTPRRVGGTSHSSIPAVPTVNPAAFREPTADHSAREHGVSLQEYLELKTAYNAQSSEMQQIRNKLAGFEQQFDRLQNLQVRLLSADSPGQQTAPAPAQQQHAGRLPSSLDSLSEEPAIIFQGGGAQSLHLIPIETTEQLLHSQDAEHATNTGTDRTAANGDRKSGDGPLFRLIRWFKSTRRP